MPHRHQFTMYIVSKGDDDRIKWCWLASPVEVKIEWLLTEIEFAVANFTFTLQMQQMYTIRCIKVSCSHVQPAAFKKNYNVYSAICKYTYRLTDYFRYFLCTYIYVLTNFILDEN